MVDTDQQQPTSAEAPPAVPTETCKNCGERFAPDAKCFVYRSRLFDSVTTYCQKCSPEMKDAYHYRSIMSREKRKESE